MTFLEGLRLVFGGIFILFAPGFAWSYVFFARKKIEWIERLALSFGLSIALVPLAVFWLNWLFDMKITLLSTSLTVAGTIVIAGIWLLARKYGWGNIFVSRIKACLKRN
ncbi:MAG: DUF1616 domain-containing protein [Dehalococcoidia bacterium]|jgi:uncharacterized membrane protein